MKQYAQIANSKVTAHRRIVVKTGATLAVVRKMSSRRRVQTVTE
jgi:hypothetical protein